VGNITGQAGASDASSRAERLLSTVLVCAGVGLFAVSIASVFFLSPPPAPSAPPVLAKKPPPPPAVVGEKPPPPPPVVAEKPPPPPQPEPQTPADYPLANEAEKPPLDPAVRDLLDRGWALVAKPYSTTRWQEARQDFEKALGLDGESNEARIGLAYVLGGKMSDEWSPVLQEDPKRAELLLNEVLDKGDTANRMSSAHFALGVVLQMQNRLPEAHKEFGFSVALDPNNARAHLHLGETSLYLGNPTCRQFEEVVRLSPSDYSIAAINNWAFGTCHLLLGNLDQAIELLQKASALNDHFWVPHLYLAGAYGLKGDLDKARASLAESLRWKPAIKTLARMQAENPWLGNPRYWELQDKTLNLGLRRVGFPDQ
jgi:tetratricopeptide (TPR) repeat protein